MAHNGCYVKLEPVLKLTERSGLVPDRVAVGRRSDQGFRGGGDPW
jgi:hypothetical protein